MQRRTEASASIVNVINGSLSQLYRFREVNFSHVGRSGNKVAHTLAQFAKSVPDQYAWVEEVPDCIEGLVAQDVM